MLGHDHVPDHNKPIFLPSALQHTQEKVASFPTSQLRPTLIATAGYEVEIVSAIPALQTLRHSTNVIRENRRRL